MTALTSEMIGVVLVAAVVVVVLVARHLVLKSRRNERSSRETPGEPAAARASQAAGEPRDMVTSAFGPAPVWAGGSPSPPVGNRPDDGVQEPPEVLAAVAPRPEPTPRTALPPPVALPMAAFSEPQSGQWLAELGAERETEHAPGEQEEPRMEPETGRESDGTEVEGPSTQEHGGTIMAVPGNSAHPSKVMHVSSLRSQVAEEIPTDWMVVTPMELLGDLPAVGAWRSDRPATESTVSESTVSESTIPESTGPESGLLADVYTGEPASVRGGVPGSPNPFEPRGSRSPADQSSPETDIGLPSSLLQDLLGSDTSDATRDGR